MVISSLTRLCEMRMTLRTLLILIGLCAATRPIGATEGIKVFPSEVQFSSGTDQQQLLVCTQQDGTAIAEVTRSARFRSLDPHIVSVDEIGIVRPVSDGTGKLEVQHGAWKVLVNVTVQGAKEPMPIRFTTDVISILTHAGCNSGACHGALAGKGGMKLSLRGYDPVADHHVITQQALGRRLDRTHPEESLFLLKPLAKMHHGGGTRIEADLPEYHLLLNWLKQGAAAPQADDPRVVRLAVYPPNIRLVPGSELRVIVQAFYNNGMVRDVTRWCKFNSSEDAVASLEEDNHVKVKGPGEASIIAWFNNQIAISSIRVPYDYPAVALPVSGSMQRGILHNRIDGLVNQKLMELRLKPSPLCSDEEFIRRAYLDTLGLLPTLAEQDRFFKDTAPDKRSKLIDSLLERPEYIDFWTYKWSDLLLVSSRKLPQQAIWSFHQYIRHNVAQNVGWDRFARALITAQGSNLDNGAVNFFLLHKDVAERAETTSITFLGMSIGCARCHNHPLEKWTQDQYWQFANLFSRVGLFNGERGGEVIAKSLPGGEVLHLRRGIPMPPTPLDGQSLPFDSTKDRREALADWLTAPENPYFAKAIINRVWRHLMGRGLVEPEDDLRLSNPSSHPELMAELEKSFIQSGYDVKGLIRLIMNSAAYQRSATALPENEPDARFYSRFLVKRLPAEVLLDVYSQLTQVPTPFNQVHAGGTGGLVGTNDYPIGIRAMQLPDTKVVSYFLDAFGRPEREVACACERLEDATVTQALHLNNGETLNHKLREPQNLIGQWIKQKVPVEAMVDHVYRSALCRPPTMKEKENLIALLNKEPPEQRRELLEDLVWAVLTSREFLFNR